jgi:hypothetical protein
VRRRVISRTAAARECAGFGVVLGFVAAGPASLCVVEAVVYGLDGGECGTGGLACYYGIEQGVQVVVVLIFDQQL